MMFPWWNYSLSYLKLNFILQSSPQRQKSQAGINKSQREKIRNKKRDSEAVFVASEHWVQSTIQMYNPMCHAQMHRRGMPEIRVKFIFNFGKVFFSTAEYLRNCEVYIFIVFFYIYLLQLFVVSRINMCRLRIVCISTIYVYAFIQICVFACLN